MDPGTTARNDAGSDKCRKLNPIRCAVPLTLNRFDVRARIRAIARRYDEGNGEPCGWLPVLSVAITRLMNAAFVVVDYPRVSREVVVNCADSAEGPDARNAILHCLRL